MIIAFVTILNCNFLCFNFFNRCLDNIFEFVTVPIELTYSTSCCNGNKEKGSNQDTHVDSTQVEAVEAVCSFTSSPDGRLPPKCIMYYVLRYEFLQFKESVYYGGREIPLCSRNSFDFVLHIVVELLQFGENAVIRRPEAPSVGLQQPLQDIPECFWIQVS